MLTTICVCLVNGLKNNQAVQGYSIPPATCYDLQFIVESETGVRMDNGFVVFLSCNLQVVVDTLYSILKIKF